MLFYFKIYKWKYFFFDGGLFVIFVFLNRGDCLIEIL